MINFEKPSQIFHHNVRQYVKKTGEIITFSKFGGSEKFRLCFLVTVQQPESLFLFENSQ